MKTPMTQLDREVAQAAAALRAGLRDLRRLGPAALAEREGGAAPESPLDAHRRVSSRKTYLELLGKEEGIGDALGLASTAPAPPPDPLSVAIAAWVYALTLERVLFPDRVRLAQAWHAAATQVEGAESVRVSPREARFALIAERSPEARRVWAEALARGAGAVADAARILVERRSEAVRRLGVEDAAQVEIPCEPPDGALRAAAGLLARTEPLVAPAWAANGAGAWDAALAAGVGRDAAAGWPARLSSRWIEELFRPTRLTDGLTLDLGALPRPIGASSFARALARFGGALAGAAAPRSAPFAMACPPFDLRRARRAALFGGLVADPAFCSRALGLGRGPARDQARATARALAVALRLDAARTELVYGPAGHVLLAAPRAAADRFEEATARALGVPLPGSLAGVVPALEPEPAALHVLGALLAARDRRALVEQFDEDWFRNPRAAEAIRGEDAALPASARASAADVDAGLDALARAVEALA